MNIELDVIVLCSCEIQNNKSKYRGIKEAAQSIKSDKLSIISYLVDYN